MTHECIIDSMAAAVKVQDNASTAYPIFYVFERLYGSEQVVQPFFTRAGAERYIEENRRNLHDPYVHVGTAYRNMEWNAIRDMLLARGAK